MSPNKTILIVEDNVVNREILGKILSQDYQVLMAENGQEALDILETHRKEIAGIVLDLIMPVMDGYTFLGRVAEQEEYSDIPIVVSTDKGDVETEKKTLQLGAWDFISKPYDADILKFRVKNAIDRSKLVAYEQLKYLAEYDTLTDIYNKTKMLSATKDMLEADSQTSYAFVRFDIERFQLVNSFFGIEMGNQLLQYVAKKLREDMEQYYPQCTYGRIEGDLFACCFPYEGEKQIHNMVHFWQEALSQFPIDFRLSMAFGIYLIGDKSEEPTTMLDKANLAVRPVKGNYVKNYDYYSQDMSNTLETEQHIVNEMNTALEQEQFDIYLQPKYNLQEGRMEGAEALVRWIHPERGVIPPGDFIPIFERNGFISKLDYYVWERACQFLRKCLDGGYDPDPISVNLSRVDLYSANLIDNICELMDKYQLPHRLLQFELTESVCAESEAQMRDVITQLRDRGFTILMDDFGSAYSSLNILKDLEVDILKVDMRFLANMEASERAKMILESVVFMAKKLELPIVVEGVETKEQAEAMTSLGCQYAQGYYFAKPMPICEYESLLQKMHKENS